MNNAQDLRKNTFDCQCCLKEANQMHSYIQHRAAYFLMISNKDNIAALEWCNNGVTEPFSLELIFAGTGQV